MKSEHRHELAENDLSKLLEKGRDRVEPHLNKVIIGTLVATVVIIGGVLLYRSQGTTDTAGAAELAAASTASEYERVAEDFDGTTVGLWAQLRAGEEHLREGIRLSLSNRSASNDSLEAAQQAFQRVLDGESVEKELREKALYGRAVGLEAMTSEQTTTRPAIEAYQQLLSAFPNSRFKVQAQTRVEALEEPATAAFYTWFHAQNPKPDDRPQPRDFPSGVPFGGNPFEGTEPPAEMPAGAAPLGASETGTPEPGASDGDDASSEGDAAEPAGEPAEPPPPPSSERQAEESTGPILP